jgi:AraC-like DNA-binding protein
MRNRPRAVRPGSIDKLVPPADMARLRPGIARLLGLGRAGGRPCPDLQALARRVRLAPHLPLSLDKEAERLGVSRWWLSRVFKRRFGVTLWEHRDYARADLAIHRLLSSDIPVEELGRSLGYTGTAQFIATFKRLTGLTPGRFRRRYTGSKTLNATRK